MIHVSARSSPAAAFVVGAAASVLYLRQGPGRAHSPAVAVASASWDASRRRPAGPVAYRVHAFAFPLWTFAAIIAGPIWAQNAWGRYWGWDPKEIWSFITWVVYAGYLHARATAGWQGKAAASSR